MEPTRTCPACSMTIAPTAVRCPHCRARQPDAPPLHRDHGRLVGGVCGGLAHELGVDAAVVRVAFAIVAAFSLGILVWAYVILWVLTPPALHGRAPLFRAMGWCSDLFTAAPTPRS